jgi:uncharacterized membrane protein HdeD (DUF308 family)
MSDEQSYPIGAEPRRIAEPPPALAILADHWGLVMAYGLASLGLGVILAVWPGETLKVVAVLVGIQFLVSGVVRIIGALASRSAETSLRVLLALTGAVAVIVGLLCLRDPLQTILTITLILGVWWVASGLIDIVGAILSPDPGRRGWDIFSGIVNVLAGGYLLVDPNLSLGVLVFITSAWLIVVGVIAIVSALRLRARRAPETAAPQTPGPAPAL